MGRPQKRSYHAAMKSSEMEKNQCYHLVMKLVGEVSFVPGLPDWKTGTMGLDRHLSRHCDSFTLQQQYFANTMYKRKKDKMLPIKTSKSTG